MALSDPQTVTVNSVAKTLQRVASGNYSGTFHSEADGLTLKVDHTFGRRNRSQARLEISKIAADVLVPSTNTPYSMTVQLFIDVPPQGFTTAEMTNNLKALVDWFTASTYANTGKIVNKES
jgi:hypothetical protein